ncbi:hypothetical protein FDB39_00820 [Clostridium botulinum]|nr:hypothetical protein [Clostridium botulinum]
MIKSKHIFSYDIIKLIMAIVIAFLHLNYNLVPQGYLCVEGFFLLGGFFISSNPSIKNYSFSEIVHKKLISLFPMYLEVIILSLIFFTSAFTIDSFIKYILYMQGIGFLDTAVSSMVPLWYLSVYFWCSILFLWLFKNTKRENVYFLCALITFISFLCLYSFNPGHAFNYSLEKFTIIPVGMIRGLANISLGILLFPIYTNIKKTSLIKSRPVLVSILQVIIIVFLIKIVSFSGITAEYDFIFVILFSALIILFKFNNGIISEIINKYGEKIMYFTNLSYPIYVFHNFIITFIKEKCINLWYIILKYPIFYLLVVIIFVIIILEVNKLILLLKSSYNFKKKINV